MALVRTTLTAAVAGQESQITVAAATGISAGTTIQVDAEFMQVLSSYVSGLILPVLRGRNGSATLPHANGAAVVAGNAADFADPPAQSAASVNLPANRVREMKSIGASGVIPNPKPGTDLFVLLTGSAVLTMTIGNPGKDNDGDIIIVANNAPAAHTITYATGFGGTVANDVVTFPAAPASAAFMAIAVNERWVNMGGGSPAPA